MLKKRVLIKKTDKPVKALFKKEVKPVSKVKSFQTKESSDLEIYTSAHIDKPKVDDVAEVFKKYQMKCCAAKLIDNRTPDLQLKKQKLREAKKYLFKELLALGMIKHMDWN